MSNDNQTQLAREEYSLDQLRAMVNTSFLPAHASDYYGAVKQLFAVLTERRVLNGSDEYRRGVEDAAKIADERVEFWDKGKSNMFGILLITEAEQCAAAIRALLTTEQGVSGRGRECFTVAESLDESLPAPPVESEGVTGCDGSEMDSAVAPAPKGVDDE